MIGWLRFGHAKCRPRARGEDRRGQIPDIVSIHDRPAEIEERLVPVHWEGDLIKGAHNRSSVGTLVERTTLFTVLARMEDTSVASAVKSFGFVLDRIEAQKRLSMTYDQDKEMAGASSWRQIPVSKCSLSIHTALGSADETRTPTD